MTDVGNRIEKVKELYQTVLGREADAGGLHAYANSKLTVEQIETALKSSDEYISKQRKLGLLPLDIDFVEPSIAVSSAVGEKHIKDILAVGITHVLDISDVDVVYNVGKDFVGAQKIKIPDSAIISVSDTKKCMEFLQSFIKGGSGKLLITGDTGNKKPVGVLMLWYVANGMSEDAATVFIKSVRPKAAFASASLGPWHFKAAKAVIGG